MQDLHFLCCQGQILIGLHFLDRVVELLRVAAEVLDSIFDLVVRSPREVNGFEPSDISSGNGYHNLKQSVLKLTELSLCLKALLNEGNKEGVEERNVVF